MKFLLAYDTNLFCYKKYLLPNISLYILWIHFEYLYSKGKREFMDNWTLWVILRVLWKLIQNFRADTTLLQIFLLKLCYILLVTTNNKKFLKKIVTFLYFITLYSANSLNFIFIFFLKLRNIYLLACNLLRLSHFYLSCIEEFFVEW